MQEQLELEDLKFPIGRCQVESSPDTELIQQWIGDIETFPSKLKSLTLDLSNEQLDWRYRPGGWMIKQVVHHCADSHMNSIIRFKLALTEDVPTIRPYEESLWAELSDSLDYNIQDSLNLLLSLHKKWTQLLKSLSKDQLERTFIHPESNKTTSLAENIGIYAWHCNHHLAHIQNAIKFRGQFKS